MTKFKLERWIYLGMGLGLAASAATTWFFYATKAKRRVPVVRLPDASALDAATVDEPSVPTIEQLLADDDAFRAASSDTFDVLAQPALDDSSSESSSESIDDDALFADELGRN